MKNLLVSQAWIINRKLPNILDYTMRQHYCQTFAIILVGVTCFLASRATTLQQAPYQPCLICFNKEDNQAKYNVKKLNGHK